MKKWEVVVAVAALVALTAAAGASTISFTAQDVKDIMASQGAPLSDGANQWGLWAVRVMPIVTGGSYAITGGATNQAGWGVSAPNGAFGAAPYTASNSAWFWDDSGAPADPANPLYMIMDKPADTFTSYFGNAVTAVAPSSFFDVFFELDLGATWDGRYQFVVDGSEYALGTAGSPGAWVQDFFGGYGDAGGLANNSGPGYQTTVPEPFSMIFFGTGIVGVCGFVARRRTRRAA